MNENVSYKSTKKRKKDRSEWDVVEGVHEPIVSRDTWDNVQRLRAGKPKSFSKYEAPNLFSGKVRCYKCGGSMRIFYSRKRRYYRCSTKFIAADRCDGTYISENVLDKLVLDEIRKLYRLYVDDENAAKQISAAKGLESKLRKLHSRTEKTLRDIDRLDKRLQAIYVDKLDGVITPEEFSTLKNKFGEDKSNSLKRLEELYSETDETEQQIRNSSNRMETIRRFKDVKELDFETVRVLIDHVEIGGDRDNRIVNIHWNI